MLVTTVHSDCIIADNGVGDTAPGNTHHVVIVGGGIAGLATAYELQQQVHAAGSPLTYTLLESDATIGGKLISDRADGFVIEGGPDSFLAQKPWATDLCRELGLGDDLIGTNDAQRATFVLNNGRLTRMPEGLNLIMPTHLVPFLRSPLISWPGKLRMALDLVLPQRRATGDESIAAFVGRRLGQEAVEKLAEPLLCGIHAGEPERQSILSTFARFRDLEQKHRSLILGARAQRKVAAATPRSPSPAGSPQSTFISLRGGVRQLIDALECALTGAIITGARVANIEQHANGYQVVTMSGATYAADAVVLATPTYVSASLMHPLRPALADALNTIRYVSTASVYLGFRRHEVSHPLDGFGFVIPRREQRRIFGCTWSSTKFGFRAPPEHVLLRCFMGGAGREEQLAVTDVELIAVARAELRDIMGLDAEPVITRVFRWHQANPQYDVGHAQRVQGIYAECALLPGIYVTGGAYEGVGVPDCVRHGRGVAKMVTAYLTRSTCSAACVVGGT